MTRDDRPLKGVPDGRIKISRPRKFDASRFADDFLIADRRLGERADIRLRIFPAGETRIEWVMGWTETRDGKFIGGYESDGFEYQVEVDRALDDQDTRLLNLMVDLVRYCRTSNAERSLTLVRRIGGALRQVRESLRLSQSQVAEEFGVHRFALSRWEGGYPSPSSNKLYEWCRALGLVAPAKTTLVRLCDVPPELLRFLKEDPARIHSLSPEKFEQFVAERLDRMGFAVTLTGATNRKDGGIDLIAVPKLATIGSVVIAGQTKHHQSRKTGREAVDRLLAWKDSPFGVGLLVTNTSFTRDAVWTAQQERNSRFLRLRGFSDLKRWLEDQFNDEADWQELPKQITLAPGVVVDIPRPQIPEDLIRD